MEIDVIEARNNLFELIDSLINKKEDSFVITKDGVPVVKMTLCSDRVGTAKSDMKKDISLEELDSIEIPDFGTN